MLLGRPIRTTMLVDSGADVTVINGGFARTLGLDLSQRHYPKTTIGGIGGWLSVARAEVKMALCGSWVDVPAYFTLDPLVPRQRPNLLGREGAFTSIVLSFVHRRQVLLAARA